MHIAGASVGAAHGGFCNQEFGAPLRRHLKSLAVAPQLAQRRGRRPAIVNRGCARKSAITEPSAAHLLRDLELCAAENIKARRSTLDGVRGMRLVPRYYAVDIEDAVRMSRRT